VDHSVAKGVGHHRGPGGLREDGMGEAKRRRLSGDRGISYRGYYLAPVGGEIMKIVRKNTVCEAYPENADQAKARSAMPGETVLPRIVVIEEGKVWIFEQDEFNRHFLVIKE
jgi:hypothetical protein